MNNRTGSLPGGGYAGDYYGRHSNESMPTSPSLSSGSVNLQNTSMPQTCDCNQINNVQEMVPTDASQAGQQAPGQGGDGAPEAGGESAPAASTK